MSKYIVSIFMCFNLLSLTVFAQKRGGGEGNGGDGHAAFFTELGYRLHRELLMENYDANKMQARDAIPLESFFAAIRTTKVIATDEVIRDNQGDVQTAIYLNPILLREKKKAEGLSDQEIDSILKESPNGQIVFNIQRFQHELSSGWGFAARTVFHEYGRSAKINESNYQTTAINFDNTFFDKLLRQSNETTKSTLAVFADRLSKSRTQLNLIDEEKRRVRSELAEDGAALKVALDQHDKDIVQTQEAFSRYGNAFADAISNMSIIPNPFPRSAGRTMRDLTKATAEGMGLQGKMTRQQVSQMQLDFLVTNVKQNQAYYHRLNSKREEIFFRSLE
jgi:hypothetical protein